MEGYVEAQNALIEKVTAATLVYKLLKADKLALAMFRQMYGSEDEALILKIKELALNYENEINSGQARIQTNILIYERNGLPCPVINFSI